MHIAYAPLRSGLPADGLYLISEQASELLDVRRNH